MATEVLKNQLIEFPQLPLASQQIPSAPSDTTTATNTDTSKLRSKSQQIELDRRSSMDLPQEEAIRVAAESARALESFKVMGEIQTGWWISSPLDLLICARTRG
jgi:hypothetical protein